MQTKKQTASNSINSLSDVLNSQAVWARPALQEGGTQIGSDMQRSKGYVRRLDCGSQLQGKKKKGRDGTRYLVREKSDVF